MPSIIQAGSYEEYSGAASPGVSVAGAGRVYFDSTDNRFKFSENAGAYGFLPKQVNATLTTGQVLIASSAGLLTGNANLFWDNTNARLGIGTSAPSAFLHIVQAVATSDTPAPAVRVAGGAHTSLTAAETIDVDFALNRIVQFTAGAAIASQRAVVFRQPTYSATAAQTITEAATLAILGEPVAGTNVTMTNSWSFQVDGRSDFFSDKPTGSDSDYTTFGVTSELGGGTQTSNHVAVDAVVRAIGSAVVSGGGILSALTGTSLQKSTGAVIEAEGVFGAALGSGAGIALGTVTNATGVVGTAGYDSDNLPTSGAITNGQCLWAEAPEGTAAGRTIATMRGLRVDNMGATGITTAIGVDVVSISGATNNYGARFQNVVLIGASVPNSTELLRVVGDVRIEGTTTTTQSLTGTTLSLLDSGVAEVLTMRSRTSGAATDCVLRCTGWNGSVARDAYFGIQASGGAANDGYAVVQGNNGLNVETIGGGIYFQFTGTTHPSLFPTISRSGFTGARTLTIADPGANADFVFTAGTQTLSNKTLASPTLTGTPDFNITSLDFTTQDSPINVRDNSSSAMTWSSTGASNIVRVDSTDGDEQLFARQVAYQTHSAFSGSEAVQKTGAVQTTDATQTTAASRTLVDDRVYQVDVLIQARRVDVAGRSVFWRRCGVFRASAGAATLIGTVDTIGADKTSGTITASVDLTVSGNDIRASVTGAVGQTINWSAIVRWQAAGGSA